MKSTLLQKKAAEPGEFPGYGQTTNLIKDLAERNGIPYEEGRPELEWPSVDVVISDLVEEAKGKPIAMACIRMSFTTIDAEPFSIVIPIDTAEALRKQLATALAKQQQVSDLITKDPTILNAEGEAY